MNASNIVVQQVGSREVKTRFGMKPTYSFKGNDGQWYNTGFKEVAAVGDNLSFDYMPNTYGNEVNVNTIVKGAPAVATAAVPGVTAPAKAAPTGNKGSFPIGPLDGQRSIVRQNALTNARELICVLLNHPDVKAKILDEGKLVAKVISVAKQFESYTTGDADLEEVKDEMAAAQKKAA